jgi:hypothetical protein
MVGKLIFFDGPPPAAATPMVLSISRRLMVDGLQVVGNRVVDAWLGQPMSADA